MKQKKNLKFFTSVVGSLLIIAAGILLKQDFDNRPPPPLTECQKEDGSNNFTFIECGIKAEFGFFGSTLVFDLPNTIRTKEIKTKKFKKDYMCRPFESGADFIKNE